MKRRTFLAATAGVAGGMAGCSGSSADGTPGGGTVGDGTPTAGVSDGGSAPFEHPGTLETTFAANGDYPPNDQPADGYPPEFDAQPPSPDADPSSFDTLSVNGERVRLAPIDVVRKWYYRREARFVDARGLEQYERAHAYGAVSSPAQRNSAGGGIEGWPYGDRVVTYCRCPHHLSSIRAAGLQKAGFSTVYALDEGFGAWLDRDYPMAGTAFSTGGRADVQQWRITGRVDGAHAGEYAWVSAGRQYEAAPIGEDGRYSLHLRFSGVSAETPVRVVTPAGGVRRPLGEVGSRA